MNEEELERFHFDYQDERHTKATVKIKSLDDLIEINQLTNQELIIDFRKNSFSGEPFIEIYDGWRE